MTHQKLQADVNVGDAMVTEIGICTLDLKRAAALAALIKAYSALDAAERWVYNVRFREKYCNLGFSSHKLRIASVNQRNQMKFCLRNAEQTLANVNKKLQLAKERCAISKELA